MIAFDQMISSLPHLSADELKVINAKCAALLSIGPKGPAHISRASSAETEFGELLYTALTDLLKDKLQIRCMPYRVFVRSDGSAKRYRDMVETAAAANEDWFPDQTKPERFSMIRLYAELIISHLQDRGLPLTWHSSIPNAVGNLPGIVDQAFPGYAASGMLGKVQAMRVKPLLKA